MSNHIKNNIRQLLKSKRLSLDHSTRSDLNQDANTNLIKFIELQTRVMDIKNIALFLSFKGEISTQPTIDYLLARHIEVSVPIIHPFNKHFLIFQKLNQATSLVKNRFGILEPQLSVCDVVPVADLDYIIMPLTGFDKQGNRLGMGGGFYDRTFSGYPDKKRLIGFAYSIQEIDSLPAEPWDLKINTIITDKTIKHFE